METQIEWTSTPVWILKTNNKPQMLLQQAESSNNFNPVSHLLVIL